MEGDNGAGKTTVMIAAYLVLLPDMTRLRFTNLGETGATGGEKGIAGRLGDPARPSYAALELALPDGERVLAGVHLERKGEVTVEPTTFHITGLRPDVRLRDLLLVQQDEMEQVPLIGELRENSARLGARLHIHGSAADYFSALFDLGVTPLRLASDEERNKLNEMLRTSMTGGISRALTSELRSFLFKEEAGLAETLRRTQNDLDECRRTRVELGESRQTEREVSGVFEVGESMFALGMLGTRERVEEFQGRLDEVLGRQQELATEEARLRAWIEEAEARCDLAVGQIAQLDGQLERARAWRERVTRALALAAELKAQHRKLEELRRAAATAESARRDAERARETLRAAQTEAREACARAAAGLANLQEGIEELHRRAAAHRRARRSLSTAREALDAPTLEAEAAAEMERQTAARVRALDQERQRLDGHIGMAEARRQEHAVVLAALSRCLGADVEPRSALATARALLSELRGDAVLAGRRSEIQREIDRTRPLVSRQGAARAKVAELGVERGEAPWVEAVNEACGAEDQQVRALEEATRATETKAEQARQAFEAAKQRIVAGEKAVSRWRTLQGQAATLEAAGLGRIASREDLNRAAAELERRKEAQSRRLEEGRARARTLREQATALEGAGGSFHADLLRIRDQLGGTLLASRFEEIPPDEAGRLEARLGPLHQAILVEDPSAAARALAGRPREVETVWLVGGDAVEELARSDADARGDDVIVDNALAVRVTARPAKPTLGRKARARRVADLRKEADGLDQDIQAEADALRSIAEQRRLVHGLLPEAGALEAGDPGPALDRTRAEAGEAAAQEKQLRVKLAQERVVASARRERARQFTGLLSDAWLLDEPDQEAHLSGLLSAQERAAKAADRLRRCEPDRALLEERLDALREPPLTEREVGDLKAQLSELGVQRDRLARAVEALAWLAANPAAIGWTEAEAALSHQQALVPSLQVQYDSAKRELERAGERTSAAEKTWEKRTEQWQSADAARKDTEAVHDRLVRELDVVAVDDPSQATLDAAAESVTRLEAALRRLAQEHQALREKMAGERVKHDSVAKSLGEVASQVQSADRDARTEEERWRQLCQAAERASLHWEVVLQRYEQTVSGRGSANRWQEARSQHSRLLEKLGVARDGRDLARELSEPAGDAGQAYLERWLRVRTWLLQRLPAFLAEVDDPLETLRRFRDRIAGLEEQLARQEEKLRGDSRGLAAGIESRVRGARTQVQRLNRSLEGVRFGTIEGIQVSMGMDETMNAVLNALREGEAQALLFKPGIPVEEALETLFKRYGGGRTGGQRLLDYREYLKIGVEVRRQGGQAWEAVNPTRVSTGEAIGIGAALMMLILTEWEREANLLRPKRAAGTLRLLFLDEANRLSRKNLAMLFDLCRNLELQLLIAAPEVEQGQGNTTYRLVRRTLEDGGEEVVVSGRRTVGLA